MARLTVRVNTKRDTLLQTTQIRRKLLKLVSKPVNLGFQLVFEPDHYETTRDEECQLKAVRFGERGICNPRARTNTATKDNRLTRKTEER